MLNPHRECQRTKMEGMFLLGLGCHVGNTSQIDFNSGIFMPFEK